jgi:steroid delta-isomerase-like uncharacterized protein
MPLTPLNIIKRYYECFNNKDYTGMVDLLTAEVAHDINQGTREIGQEKFRQFLIHMDKHYDETIEELVLFSSSEPNRVAAEFIVQGRYKQTEPGFPPARGQSYRIPVGAFFQVRDGLIERVTNYYNVTAWREMVESN